MNNRIKKAVYSVLLLIILIKIDALLTYSTPKGLDTFAIDGVASFLTINPLG